jgi:hypothetical protein
MGCIALKRRRHGAVLKRDEDKIDAGPMLE